jgi:hypothetical protein
VNILKVCSKIGPGALHDGEMIHNHLITATPTSASTYSISPVYNLTIWNSLISMYTRCGAPSKALQLWKDRNNTIIPDKFSMSCILSACAVVGGSEGLAVGREVHKHLQHVPHHAWDTTLFTALVNMYTKCNSPRDAIHLWKDALNFGMQSERGTLKCFLKACSDVGSKEALAVGQKIQAYISTLPAGEVDMALHNSLINMLWKCGDAIGAVAYWDGLVAIKSSVNLLIATTALLACAQIGPEALERGKSVNRIMESPEAQQDLLYVSALIGMYSKCGDVDAAVLVWSSFSKWFESQQRRNPLLAVVCAAALGTCAMIEPPENAINMGQNIRHFAESHGCTPLHDLRLCNSLMLMYAKCGASDDAIKLWQQLQASNQLQPNEHSYVAILTACANKGQMAYEMGKSICSAINFDAAAGEQTILNVYSVIVNMYGKCGSWEEAEVCKSNLRNHNTNTYLRVFSIGAVPM